MEKQFSQIAQHFTERPQGALPSNTEINLKAQVNVIKLRSRKVGPESEPTLQHTDPIHAKTPTDNNQENTEPKNIDTTKPPLVPYPVRLLRQKIDEQFTKFVSLLKQLHINLTFVEVLTQMPKYSKFMRDFLTHKRKTETIQQVTLSEECSAALLNKLPRKKIDPGSFTIPCSIGRSPISNTLADLGARIYLMSATMFNRLGLSKPHPTKMSIQLADRSVKYPQGVIENLLVTVGEFVFPTDFVILDMEEDTEIPLILGRPFLATARAMVDMSDGQLTLRVGEKEIKFEVGQRVEDEPVEYLNTIDSSLDDALQRYNS
ncbi:uncharacterized protein LOC110900699 [Helianthus annuus]|uniref:uncharacterized protein LOC110900699 n=1 Tax=Helianthus annuus TaxID=4232 RepID=UPI000B9068CF|nr:uncharacterized protein LOC110900699 [Helianthus annuus]